MEVADGVFAYVQPDGSWMINNTGFLVGRDGVSAIDACSTERRTRDLLDDHRRRSPPRRCARWSTPTTTPTTPRATGCSRGATIVAHENARAEMRMLGLPHNTGVWTDVDYGDLELTLPFLTFADRLTLWADDLRCELLFAAAPRTRPTTSSCGSPSARCSSPATCCSTAARRSCCPGSVLGAIDVLENFVRPLGARRSCPATGRSAGPEIIDEVLGYLRFVRDVAAQRPRRRRRAARAGPRNATWAATREWSDPERIVGNLHRAYADLAVPAEAAAAAPIDFPGALADMVAYNGGPAAHLPGLNP